MLTLILMPMPNPYQRDLGLVGRRHSGWKRGRGDDVDAAAAAAANTADADADDADDAVDAADLGGNPHQNQTFSSISF